MNREVIFFSIRVYVCISVSLLQFTKMLKVIQIDSDLTFFLQFK